MHVFPDLVRLEKKYPRQVVVLGVHTPKFDREKSDEAVRKAMQRYEIHHPVLNDANRKVWTTYGINSWPSVVLVDPEGYLVGGLANEHVYEQFDKAVAKLIQSSRAKGTLKERPLAFQKAAASEGKSPLYFPGKVLADAASNRLFIADSTHHRVVITDLEGRKIAIAGTGTAGKEDGAFSRSTFSEPQGMALKGDILYVADRKNHLIRALNLKTQTVRTVAGTGRQAPYPPTSHGGSPLQTPLNSPWDVLVLGNTLYIAMAGHHQIWALSLTRPWLAPFAGNAEENIRDGSRTTSCFAQPSGLATDGSNLYVADSEDSAIRAISLLGPGRVRTLVGKGLFDFGDVDGMGPQVRLQHPLGLVYHDHKLYVADSYNHKIKVLDPATRVCRTFVGGTEEEPLFHEPSGISYANGKLYVADTNANRIRVVDLKTRQVSTLALEGVAPPR